MKNLIAYRTSNGLSKTLLFIISFTFLIVWLPLLRSIFDGETYIWGATYFGMFFGGAGINADFLYLVVQVPFFFALIASFYWIEKRAWFYTLITIWYVHVFGNIITELMMSDDVMFHGDTLGVHISLFWIAVPLALIAALLIFFVIVKDIKSETVNIKWTDRNKNAMWLILGPLPLQAILFAIGEPHGITDQIGVLISIAQCILLPMICFPKASESKS